jgi:hypothetical protein
MKIKDEWIKLAEEFARKKQPTSYPRFGESAEQQKERITVGKIGELVGQAALADMGIPHTCPSKLVVVEEMSYGDVADCTLYPNTKKEKKVDFKCAWKTFHKRILVPEDMFESQYKDVYIGIKIDIDKKEAEVYGYVSRDEMKTKHDVTDFGEGPAYWVYLKELHPLEELKNL